MSTPRPRREARYRGYKIAMEKQDLCWIVRVSPTRAELSALSSPFRTITQSERGAMAQAKQRIDEVLRSSQALS